MELITDFNELLKPIEGEIRKLHNMLSS